MKRRLKEQSSFNTRQNTIVKIFIKFTLQKIPEKISVRLENRFYPNSKHKPNFRKKYIILIKFSRQANFHEQGKNETREHIQLGGVLLRQRKLT